MQVVVAIPTWTAINRLKTSFCGVPLLRRLIATAARAGATKVLLVLPSGCPRTWLAPLRQWQVIDSLFIDTAEIGCQFDPTWSRDWHEIEGRLDDRFLWIPPDYLPHRAPLHELMAMAVHCPNAAVKFSEASESTSVTPSFDKPVVLLKCKLLDGLPQQFEIVTVNEQPGVSTHCDRNVTDIEKELVRRSGKVTDGIYSRFNRKICRPVVRWLTHTGVTPNAVSAIGVVIAVLAGLCFAEGTWPWNTAGAALFFLSGLIDEIDGMVARLTFQESPFGCWLETFADYSSYLLMYAGMTVGGYRRVGWIYLVVGTALLCGCIFAFVTISVQRSRAAAAQPTEYYRHYLKALDQDSRNPVSKVVRRLQFLLRKGVLIHYVLLFAILNIMPVLFFLSAVGANAAWIVTLYFNRRLFRPGKTADLRVTQNCPVQTEVER